MSDIEYQPGEWHTNHPCSGIIHVVQRGDTLYKISRQYEVNLASIMAANPYANVYNLQPGDEICIPKFSNFY